jgi:hypothetical protein
MRVRHPGPSCSISTHSSLPWMRSVPMNPLPSLFTNQFGWSLPVAPPVVTAGLQRLVGRLRKPHQLVPVDRFFEQGFKTNHSRFRAYRQTAGQPEHGDETRRRDCKCDFRHVCYLDCDGPLSSQTGRNLNYTPLQRARRSPTGSTAMVPVAEHCLPTRRGGRIGPITHLKSM